MLNIPRLRNALKKLESSSDLAKFLLQRATAVAGTINKEYDATTLENLPTVTSSAPSSAVVTSLSKSLPPPTTHTFAKSSAKAPAEAIVGTEQENQPKTITAAIATVSLFSRLESSSGAAKVTASQSNLREQSVLQGNNNFTENRKSAQEPQNQTNYTMSDAKAKEVTNHQAVEAASQLPKSEQQATCNGASCGSGSDQKQSNGSSTEKSCFKSSLADILHFMELVGNLKHTKRTGWVLRDVNDCESISGHMYRMSMMTFLLDGSEGLNQIRCMELALVHDLAESLVGDLTPFCGVAKEDKKAMELKAMEDICKLIEPRGKRIMELFEEYEGATSAESKFVKDLDRLDMVMQAFEYEKRDNCLMKHQEFFDSTEGKFQHPFVQKLVQEICDQRKALAETKGVANECNPKLKTVTPNCPPCLEHKNERS